MSQIHQQFERSVKNTSRAPFYAEWYKGRTRDVFAIIIETPGCTVDELANIFNARYGSSVPRNELAKVVSCLLHRERVITIGPDRVCAIKGVLEMTHSWTGHRTNRAAKNPTRKELINRIEELEKMLQAKEV